MKFLREDMKRGFFNPGFFAGFFGLGALLTYNFVTESLHSGSPYYAIVNILAVSGFTVFLGYRIIVQFHPVVNDRPIRRYHAIVQILLQYLQNLFKIFQVR